MEIIIFQQEVTLTLTVTVKVRLKLKVFSFKIYLPFKVKILPCYRTPKIKILQSIATDYCFLTWVFIFLALLQDQVGNTAANLDLDLVQGKHNLSTKVFMPMEHKKDKRSLCANLFSYFRSRSRSGSVGSQHSQHSLESRGSSVITYRTDFEENDKPGPVR